MIAAAFLLLLQAAPADDEVLIFARKLDAVSVWLAPDATGKLSCGMNQSSGDAKTDAQLCKTAAACLKKGASGQDAMKSCIDARKPDLLRAFADQLKAKQS